MLGFVSRSSIPLIWQDGNCYIFARQGETRKHRRATATSKQTFMRKERRFILVKIAESSPSIAVFIGESQPFEKCLKILSNNLFYIKMFFKVIVSTRPIRHHRKIFARQTPTELT